MNKPKMMVFASGTATGGGSGFENLVQATKTGALDAEIVAVVSNREHGGVEERAKKLGVPFTYFPGPFDAEGYSSVLSSFTEVSEDRQKTGIAKVAPWVALSGWLKKVEGLDPRKTFNIHPALLSQLGGRFGGPGMYGHRVHEAVADALEEGEIQESGLTMHFVTDMYDRGPAFFEYRVPLLAGMDAEEIAVAVNTVEHEWQPKITNMVVHEEIAWDGKDPNSLVFPEGYTFAPKALD